LSYSIKNSCEVGAGGCGGVYPQSTRSRLYQDPESPQVCSTTGLACPMFWPNSRYNRWHSQESPALLTSDLCPLQGLRLTCPTHLPSLLLTPALSYHTPVMSHPPACQRRSLSSCQSWLFLAAGRKYCWKAVTLGLPADPLKSPRAPAHRRMSSQVRNGLEKRCRTKLAAMSLWPWFPGCTVSTEHLVLQCLYLKVPPHSLVRVRNKKCKCGTTQRYCFVAYSIKFRRQHKAVVTITRNKDQTGKAAPVRPEAYSAEAVTYISGQVASIIGGMTSDVVFL
jgi:hypothetical protein